MNGNRISSSKGNIFTIMYLSFSQDVQKEQDSREDSKNSIQQTGERLLAKPNISKPNSETIQTRLDILLTRWDILRADIATRTRGVESKLRRVSEFLGSLEELSSWAATTRELLEKQEGGIYNQEIVDPKVCYLIQLYGSLINLWKGNQSICCGSILSLV